MPPGWVLTFCIGAVAGSTAIFSSGCGIQTAARPPGYVKGSGAEIDSLAKIGAGCPSSKSAKLNLAGDSIPVELACTDANGDVDVKLTAHNALFEEERYHAGEARFDLVDAAGETYDPPITLARAPMNIGDKWTWNGQMKAGDVGHTAKATISTSQERIFPPTGAIDALKVQVDFEIESGTPTPAKRSLSFWLAPGLGVVRRQFGSSSMREPAGP